MAKGFGPLVVRPQEGIETKILRQSVIGADSFVAIKTYGKAKQAWLEKFLDLPNETPSHDTCS